MDAKNLAEIRDRCSRATPGPWTAYDRTSGGGREGDGVSVLGYDIEGPPDPMMDRGQFGRGADAEFIAHAREDVPRLLAHIDALTATVDRWREDCDGEYRGRVKAEAEIAELEAVIAEGRERESQLREWIEAEIVACDAPKEFLYGKHVALKQVRRRMDALRATVPDATQAQEEMK